MINYSLILQIKYPKSEWSLDGNNYEGLTWLSDTPKPSREELDAQWNEVLSIRKKQDCKDQAKILIANCDWSVLSDVNIKNKSDFENYRSQLRNFILNPVEDPIYPEEPQPIWS